jgi:hypothetical protein
MHSKSFILAANTFTSHTRQYWLPEYPHPKGGRNEAALARLHDVSQRIVPRHSP